MIKHLAIPQDLLNEKARLDFADTSGMTDAVKAQHEADLAANIAELAKYGDQPMTADEITARQAEEAAAAATQPRLDLLAQIASIESSITSRRIREAVIGIDAGWLAAREAEISTLRVQL